MEVGTALPRRSFQLRREDLVRYAGASGDFNVIHWSSRLAKAVGLPDVIAHGMLTMATAGRFLTDWVGDPGGVIRYGVRFSAPVVVADDEGATVDVDGVLEQLHDDGTATIDLVATAQGHTVMRAKAVLRVC